MIAITVSLLSLAISFLAITFAIVSVGRVRERVLSEIGDPTSYTVVTNGEFYRVRGPFDTFYTIKFRDLDDAEKYRDQLAHWHRSVFDERNWRAVA